jgi:hypothetical protein
VTHISSIITNLIQSEHEIVLNSNVDLWCIGDVHGCYLEYMELVKKISKESKNEYRIIQLGDLIDRGPEFKKIIILEPADYMVIGNHEWNFVNEWYGNKKCKSKARQLNHESLKQEYEYLQHIIVSLLMRRKTHFYTRIGDRDYVFTHAPLSNVEEYHTLDKYNFSKFNIAHFAMRSTSVDREKMRKNIDHKVTFIHGHQQWDYTEIEDQKNSQKDNDVQIYNIDSGCVYGKELVALRVHDLKVLRVSSEFSFDTDKTNN